MADWNRGRMLVAAVVLAVLAISGVAAAAPGKTVYFLSWGGTIQTMLEKEGWAQQFTKDTGYTLVLVPKATSSEIIATAIAQKDRPQVDVVMCDLAAWQDGLKQGVFAAIDQGQVPNLARLYPIARVRDKGVEKGVFTYADVVGLLYQPDVFKKNGWAPPTGWKDLMRPELKGKIIIPPVSNTYGLYTLIELARMNGGGERDVEPGFVAMKKLAPGVVDWTTTFAKIGGLMQSETAAIAVFGNGSGWELKKRGVPMEVVIPAPAYMSPTVAGVVQGAPNPEGARVLLNWLISEKVLQYRAERFGQTPMNRDVKLTGEAAERVVTGKDFDRLAVIDYEYVGTQRAAWNARFEREVAPIK
ncbi:MAG: extracellular solute-binding protein [Candidatus Rokubacteria bacterium]|nr:extracellular solute-binding protein [Candidatus Rokubacteria bacterium]